MRKTIRVIWASILFALLFLSAGCGGAPEALIPASQEVEPEIVAVDLYFLRVDADQEYLEKVTRQVPLDGDEVKTSVEELIKGPGSGSDLKPVLPAATRILSCRTSMGICLLDLSREAILDGASIGPSATRERLVLGAVANTVTSNEGTGTVVLTIEGRQAGELEGHRIENFWGNVKLPNYMMQDQGLTGRKEIPPPAWQGIDRMALAESWRWAEINRGSGSVMRMSITIDGGSGGAQAAGILDTLKDNRVHCTFFLTGQFMQDNPAAVARMVEEGHEIGNHSYSHPHFNQLDEAQAVSQIQRTEEKLAEFGQYSMQPYFRFPYGERGAGQIEMLRRRGYVSVMWTADSMGWDSGTSPETVYARVMKAASPGAIILMHFDSAQDAQMLPLIVRDLQGMGYELVTITELLSPGPGV